MMQTIYKCQDFQEVLQAEFEERSKRNSSYSLRAFARDLKMPPTRVSDILNRRYGISADVASKLGKSLGLTREEQEFFIALVESKHARAKTKRRSATKLLNELRPKSEYQDLQLESFKIISDWYHLAILELTYLKDFESKPAWIAKKLGINITIAEKAIERLLNLEMLELIDGKLQGTEDFMQIPGGTPSQAIKNFHEQVMTKAQKALFRQPVEKRGFSSLIMATKEEHIEDAKKAIIDFSDEFSRKFGSETKDNDKVYCLSMQFFNLEE